MNSKRRPFLENASLVGALFVAGLAWGGSLTPGSGTTYDFAAISARRFDPKPVGVNMATNRWQTGEFLHVAMADDAKRAELTKKVGDHTHYCERNGERFIIKDHALTEALGDDWSLIRSASACYSQKIPVDGKGGRYRASMEYKTCHYGHRSGTSLQVYGATGSYSDYPLIWHLVGENWNAWSYYRHDFDVKPGVKDFTVYVRCYGLGDLGVRNLRVERLSDEAVSAYPVELVAAPVDWLDGRFAVSQNQPGLLQYDWRRSDEVKLPADAYDFVYTLPKGFELVDLMFAKDGKWTSKVLADGSTEFRFRHASGAAPGKKLNGWLYKGVMVTSSAPIGTEGVARMSCEVDGKRVSNVHEVTLYVVPAIRCAATPKRYWNGFHQASNTGFLSPRAEVNARYAKFLYDCGMRIAKCSADMSPYMRAAGFERILREVKVANGFQIGEARKAPASEKYVGLGLSKNDAETTVCPMSVYQEKPFFRNETLPLLKRQTEGCDGIWANWEPWHFENKGCMCTNCCAEYAKWLKLPYEEVAKDWPACIDRYKGRFGKTATKFRSWQHAQLVRTINRYITDFTGGEGKSMGFCVGVEHGQMMSNWRELNLTPEVAVIDYAKYTPWLDPWGPYSGVWDIDAPYVYSPGYSMLDFFNALDCRSAADRDWPHVKLLAMPHGIQCGNTTVIQPEHLEMNLDAYFFANWDAATVYFFPKGYDARHLRAVANATARAAEYESYVKDGKRIDDKVSLAFAADFPPALATAHPTLWASGADFVNYRNPRLLQTIAWERTDGARIVVAFNFREDGPANFNLAFADRTGTHDLSVPACRTAVFEFPAR